MGIVEKTRGNVVGGNIAYLGSHKLTWGSAAPTAGNWEAGDICFNTAPTANTATDTGWTCTATGTPGTWKAFGNVAA